MAEKLSMESGVGGGKGFLKESIYVWLRLSSLWCARLSVAVSRGYCLVVVWKLLIAVVSLGCREHGPLGSWASVVATHGL